MANEQVVFNSLSDLYDNLFMFLFNKIEVVFTFKGQMYQGGFSLAEILAIFSLVVGMFLAARKDEAGWKFMLTAHVAWALVALKSGSYGLLAQSVALMFVTRQLRSMQVVVREVAVESAPSASSEEKEPDEELDPYASFNRAVKSFGPRS